MSLRFYTGASGAGKSTGLYKEIIARSQQEPDRNFLIIVPDQFTMQTQKDLVMMHPRQGIMNIDVLSFGRLSHRIFEEVGADERPVLDDTGKSLVLRGIAGQLKGETAVIGGNLPLIGGYGKAGFTGAFRSLSMKNISLRRKRWICLPGSCRNPAW